MVPTVCKTIAALCPIFLCVALAQDTSNNNVIGCPTVGCPNTTCTIANSTFTGIGVAPIVPASSNTTTAILSTGLFWVQASGVDDRTATNATFTDSFYLATTPSQQLTGQQASCAVFFRRVNATFPGGAAASATGTCANALRQDCIDALTRRAAQLDAGDAVAQDVCAKLQAEFEKTLDGECAEYAYGQDKWQDVSSQSIASRAPITAAENATSNCWPILPKTDDLTLISTFTNFSEFNDSTEPDFLYELTPVLSVFYPSDNDRAASSPGEAQLTCLKVVQQGVGANVPPSEGLASIPTWPMSRKVLVGVAGFAVTAPLLF